MQFEVTEEEAKKAKVPHEIFLTNLIGNHILWFVAALGLARSNWYPLAMVPVVSIICLSYTIWGARRSRRNDSWFVMCHWQIGARRSKVFLIMFLIFGLISGLGWVAYTHLGMMKEAVYAIIGGAGVLPIMVTTLVLIIMESDVLHQATQGKLPKSILAKYPHPEGITGKE